jgi:hypothetical protein
MSEISQIQIPVTKDIITLIPSLKSYLGLVIVVDIIAVSPSAHNNPPIYDPEV